METFVKPISWDEFSSFRPEEARQFFQDFRTPGTGEQLILKENQFVETILPIGMFHELEPDELETYRAPFQEPKDRFPTLAWPREYPIDGEPRDVVAAVDAFDEWLGSSTEVPKLLLTFEPGVTMTEPVVRWCRDHIAALEIAAGGKALHYAQEDEPEAIARLVAEWRRRVLR
jgi:haloalkane dehalogenase